jgi:hypothetical protein
MGLHRRANSIRADFDFLGRVSGDHCLHHPGAGNAGGRVGNGSKGSAWYINGMNTSHLQLTPEMRAALLAHPGEPLHIADNETRKVYLVIEEGTCPELEEEYIRDGLRFARDQIARGEVSNASIDQVIAKAKERRSS